MAVVIAAAILVVVLMIMMAVVVVVVAVMMVMVVLDGCGGSSVAQLIDVPVTERKALKGGRGRRGGGCCFSAA